MLLRELYRLNYKSFLFPTPSQCHSTRGSPPPPKDTALTFIADNARPPGRANAAAALAVAPASVQAVLTAQAAVIPKSVTKAN